MLRFLFFIFCHWIQAHYALTPIWSCTSCSADIQSSCLLVCLHLIPTPAEPHHSRSPFPALPYPVPSATICPSPSLPRSPPYLTCIYMCVSFLVPVPSLPSLLFSRFACCTAPRRRPSWSLRPPGPPVRPGPLTCGSRWGRPYRAWAWRTCLRPCLRSDRRGGGTSLGGGSLGACPC